MNAKELKAKLKKVRPSLSEEHAVRLHRSISWLNCAEKYKANTDLKFISLWIAFNACYAINTNKENQLTERTQFTKFISRLIEYDYEKRIFNLLWLQFSGPVKLLIENQYVFKPFWDYQRGEITDWKHSHEKSIENAMKFLSEQQVAELLEVVLDRLYILRNQILHGGATYESKVNRAQVKDGGNMLQLIIPIIIEIMMEHNEENWGKIYYPVVD